MASIPQHGVYTPIDVLKQVAADIWIVDSGPLKLFGMPLPVRMTVVRLTNGDLWLHSPTRFTDDLRRQLEHHGTVKHLIAPDIAHWSFLQEWQRIFPDALTWAAPGLQERRAVQKAGVKIDHVLSDTAPPVWSAELEQVVVPGFKFAEVDFFHRSSRTVVMTDLVQNLETEAMPLLARAFARLNGVAAPNGRAPIYLRQIVRAKRQRATRAAEQILSWQPQRVIFSHGRWYDHNAVEALRRSLDWLLA